MKKRLSLLMVLMMVLSLVPMSVFAASGTMPGGRVEANDNETVIKEVSVKLTQAAYTKLNQGSARLTLNKGEFAKYAPESYFVNPADYTKNNNEFEKIQRVAFNVGGEEIKYAGSLTTTKATYTNLASTTAKLKDVSLTHAYNQSGLLDVTLDRAFANVAHLSFPIVEMGAKDMEIMLTLYVLFDEEDAGDVTLAVEEVGTSGLKVADPIKVGVIKEGKSKDLQLVVADKEKKIGMEGGTLSKVEVKEFKNSEADKIVLELPDYMTWEPNMKSVSTKDKDDAVGVSINGTRFDSINNPNVVDVNKEILTISGVVSGKDFILVEPVVGVTKRDASLGDISLKATSYKNNSRIESLSEVIGVVASYDVVMKAREKDKKEIPALYGGDKAKIRVKLSGVVGSFTNNRDIDFTINGAKVVPGSIKNVSNFKDTSVQKKSITTPVVTYSDIANYDVDRLGYVKDGEFTLTNGTEATTKKDLEFELEIKTDYSQNGPVVLKADARDFGVIECELAKVTPAYTVEFANVTSIKKGESKATADIVIKEAKAGLLETDEYIVLNLRSQVKAQTDFGVDYKIETTNGLKVEDQLTRDSSAKKRDLDTIALAIKTTSTKEAATITISNLTVNVSGSAVDGDKLLDSYVVTRDEIGNPAKAIALEEAIFETTKDAKKADYSKAYVNVVKEYGTVAKTTVFKIGSKEYTVNGEAKTANEAPYISGKGYTMLPVRAVAESLGLTSNWNAATKTASFANAEKVASVVIGADTMYVNGTPFKLSAKAEIKNGSTFVELRSLAAAFGVKLEWDAATKSVTIQG